MLFTCILYFTSYIIVIQHKILPWMPVNHSIFPVLSRKSNGIPQIVDACSSFSFNPVWRAAVLESGKGGPIFLTCVPFFRFFFRLFGQGFLFPSSFGFSLSGRMIKGSGSSKSCSFSHTERLSSLSNLNSFLPFFTFLRRRRLPFDVFRLVHFI